MDTHLKKVEDWDKDLQQLENAIRTATTARNATRPVNLFSNEILSAIFANYQALEFPVYGDQWMPAQVCRRWRQIALGSARFWRHITISNGTPLSNVEELLRRSGNAPLVVSLISKHGIPEDMPALIRVMKELSRFESFVVKGDTELFEHLLVALEVDKVDTPALCELSLLPGPIPAATCYSFHSGIDLRRLLDKTRLLNHTLRVLSLTLCGIPKIDDLRVTLNGLPHIEVLHLLVEKFEEPTDLESDLFVGQPIPMPHLRSLRLSVFHPITSTFLLHSLIISPSCALCVDWLGYDIKSDCWSTIQYSLAKRHRDAKKDFDDVPLVMLDSGSSDLGLYNLSLSLWWNLDLLTLERTGYRCRPMITVNTSLMSRHHLDTLLQWMHILPETRRLILGDLVGGDGYLYMLENLEELSIRHDKPTSSHILIKALQRRISQDAPTLMFPKLQKLHLHSITFDDSWEPVSQPAEDRRRIIPLKSSEDSRTRLSLDCLKTALEKRKKEGLPVSSLILTNPVGLQRSELDVLVDAVDTVWMDGKIISGTSADVDRSHNA